MAQAVMCSSRKQVRTRFKKKKKQAEISRSLGLSGQPA